MSLITSSMILQTSSLIPHALLCGHKIATFPFVVGKGARLQLKLPSDISFTVDWFWSVTRLPFVGMERDYNRMWFGDPGFRLTSTSRLSEFDLPFVGFERELYR